MVHKSQVVISLGVSFLVLSCFDFGSGPVTPPDSSSDITETADDDPPETEADPGEEVSPLCGNGALDPGEECDDGNFADGDGCDRGCTFSCHADNECDDDVPCTDNVCDPGMHQCAYPVTAAGALCRPSAGSCDIEESCDGSSPACPPDLFESPATACREAAGSCDIPEICTGGSGRCPTNTFAPSGQVCDDDQMCTQGDHCDGNGRCTGAAIDHLYGVAAISSGPYHTCALLGDGQIRCWGLNNHGQLGDGTTMNKITPAPVSGLPEAARAVSCGAYHTCVVLTSGGIFCWGYNVSGQLGDGTTTDRMTPAAVTTLASGVSAVSSGGYHTCALLDGGGVMCWGQNSRGQLGNGSTVDSHDPAAVSGLTPGAAAVTAGGYHGCAMLTSGGPPRCWGYNEFGQIGDGSATNRSTPVAVSMPGGRETVSLAAGRYHTCALTNTGEMMCWGYNADGQLGDASTVNRPTPTPVGGLTAEAVTLSLGYFHTCAVLLNNDAYCWGQNGYGQLGNGTTLSSPLPVQVAGLGSAAGSTALGYYHSCALLASGEVSCWGQNNYGQLGNGSMLDSVAPVQVSCR